jgi:hypothetical protein
MSASAPITARLAVNAPAIALPEGALPDEIQWMPPGTHEICAQQAGKNVVKTVRVDPAGAERMQRLLDDYLQRANTGAEDRPFIDFNHDDAEAAAHIAGFRWGGDDPRAGGIRAKIQWTEPGKAALTGRAYRRFSPTFHIDTDGHVTGAPVNMGGLVNRAAFKGIQPIWSRAGDEGAGHGTNHTLDQNTMDNQTPNPELSSQIKALADKLGAIEARLAQPDPRIVALETQLAALQDTTKIQAKDFATARVRDAICAGKLPPQNVDLIGKWEALIALDAKNADLLAALPENPAFKSVIPPVNPAASAPAAGAQAFADAVKAEIKAGKSKTAALHSAINAKPADYAAWRDANGQPGL